MSCAYSQQPRHSHTCRTVVEFAMVSITLMFVHTGRQSILPSSHRTS